MERSSPRAAPLLGGAAPVVKGPAKTVHRRLPAVLTIAALVCAGLLAGPPASSAEPPSVQVTNLRMASWGDNVALEGGRLAYYGVEADQGRDFNGDGDTTDYVPHVWDPQTGSPVNLGLAAGMLHPLAGGRMAFPVYEYAQGRTDFNGDGQIDSVQNSIFVWDPATGRATDLGIGALDSIVPFGNGVALQVMESREGSDFNGDGDTEDFVVHVWDPAGGLRNLMVASVVETLVALDGGRLAFLIGESDQDHHDPNFDGTSDDRVLAVYDPANHTVWNSRLAADGNDLVALDGGSVGFLVPEDDQGHQDRNGDGDDADKVAAVWDPVTDVATNLGLAGLAAAAHLGAGGGRFVFTVVEADQGGRDLNGDGDAADKVVHVWDPITGTENLKLAAARYGFNLEAVGSGRFAFLATEEEQGGRDRNGDGDAADLVVQVWEAGAGTRNLGLASIGDLVALDSGVLAFRVLEDGQGGTDLNADGDDDDAAMYVWDPTHGARNLGISAMGYSALEGGRLAISVWERFEGGQDRSGNGDTIDELVHVWDPGSDTIIDLGYASTVNEPDSLGAGRLSFMVYEAMQHADLNGDGDRNDHVVHVATLGPGGGVPPVTVRTPLPAPGSGRDGDPDPAPAPGPAGGGDPAAGRRSGYWLAGAGGAVFAFGDAGHHGNATPLSGASIVDLEPSPGGAGYWLVDDRGHVTAAGDASLFGHVDAAPLAAGERITSLSATRTGDGYWIFTSKGRAFTFGDAVFHGDVSKLTLNGPVLDSIVTPTGNGYYMVAADGGIFAFGDAEFFGSMGGARLNAAVQSLVPDPDGAGYWLVAADGGVFAFEALFQGSLGAVRLNKPITGMVSYGDGYLMVGEDGGIFNFSDRPFSGSLGAQPPPRPIVAVAALS